MKKFRIGEYFEFDKGQETPHQEKTIEAKNIEEARKIANKEYGWGSWASTIVKIVKI